MASLFLTLATPAGEISEEQWQRNCESWCGTCEWADSLVPKPHILPHLRCDATELGEVLAFMHDVTRRNITIDWPALAQAGVRYNTPITLRMRDVEFTRAIDAILNNAQQREPLAFVLDGMACRISSRARLEQEWATRVYDVRDLLAGPGEKGRTIEELVQLIQATVAPAAWKQGTIKPHEGQLVVSASVLAQRDVASFLQDLRNSLAMRVDIGVKFGCIFREELARDVIRRHIEMKPDGTGMSQSLSGDEALQVLKCIRQTSEMKTSLDVPVYSGQFATCIFGRWANRAGDDPPGPDQDKPKPGVLLPAVQVRPVVMGDGRGIRLSVRPYVLVVGEKGNRISHECRGTVTLPRAGFVITVIPLDPLTKDAVDREVVFFVFVIRASIAPSAAAEAK